MQLTERQARDVPEAPTTRKAAATILVVDDDEDMRWILKAALADLGCAAVTVGTAQNAISSVTDHEFPVALVDAKLPDMDGLRLVSELRRLRPAMRIVMISGYYLEDDARIREALRTFDIDGFLAKPFQIAAILAAVTSNKSGNSRPH